MEGGEWILGVKVNEDEPFEIALRRFKKQCERAGILSEVRKRQFYEKPILLSTTFFLIDHLWVTS